MKLTELAIKGFKSIDNRQEQTIPLGDITLLLGANGSGKSNLVSFFKMLEAMSGSKLQEFIGKYGVNQVLFYGPKMTDSIWFRLQFKDGVRKDSYEVKLGYGLPDRLFVVEEKTSYQSTGQEPAACSLPTGGAEIIMGISEADKDGDTNWFAYSFDYKLFTIRAYQFYDTSDSAKIKDRVYVDDAACLRSDGGNLAAFLKMLKETPQFLKYYQRIVRHIQVIMPQFKDFELATLPGNDRYVRLNWKDAKSSDYLFGPDQISDGSLRFMALATLLLQPPELLPKFIVIDEPELGLHPAAIVELAGMVKRASSHAQILLATQSMRLLDEFNADQVVVVERDQTTDSSVFKKLDSEQLAEWLERYSLSDLWEKNVLGGQP